MNLKETKGSIQFSNSSTVISSMGGGAILGHYLLPSNNIIGAVLGGIFGLYVSIKSIGNNKICNRNQSFTKPKTLEEEIKEYKGIIHDLADSLHNIGSTPLSRDKDNRNTLSEDEFRILQSLFRILRRISRTDISNNENRISYYKGVIEVIQHVAEKRVKPLLTIEMIEKIEEEITNENFIKLENLVRIIKNPKSMDL